MREGPEAVAHGRAGTGPDPCHDRSHRPQTTQPTTPHPTWEAQPVFRELFLAHAPPRLAVALRKAGRVLYEDLLEAGLPAVGHRLG